MSSDPLILQIHKAYAAAEPTMRSAVLGGCWVMDRASYDRVRADLVTPEQEQARAAAHAHALIRADAEPPLSCHVCGAEPFETLADLCAHIGQMADPDNREPSGRDYLLGLPIVVREDAGTPHVERRADLPA